MFYPVLVILFCYAATAFSATLGPCKKDDDACVTKAVNQVHSTVFSGIPSLGIPSSDPLFQKIIEGDLSILKFKLINTTVVGFKDCNVKSANLEFDALKLSYELDCPSISLAGVYEISGRLIVLPVEGKGTYSLVTSRYSIKVDAGIKIINGKDEESYMNLKDFTVTSEALGPIKFDFQNLFNGQKDLADAVLKFAHENWKEVADFVQAPIMNKNMKTIIGHYNKFLKTQPLKEIFLD